MSNPNVEGILVLKDIQTILKREGLYRGSIDGLPGPMTEAALEALEADARSEYKASKTAGQKPLPIPPVVGMPDERSAKHIASLHAIVRPHATAFIVKLNKRVSQYGITAKIIEGHRTYEEQNALYAQGRTRPGKRVTNARGGYSNHNFGVAFDIGLFRGSDYLEDSPYYKHVGVVAHEMNLVWGGDWPNFVDEPHVEYPTGLSLAQMRQRVAEGKSVIA